MAAHVACRPDVYDGNPDTGCFVVCADHDLRIAFRSSHDIALAACREHNSMHHPEHRRNGRPLLSLIYHSIQSVEMTESDLAGLLLRARHTNRSIGITGMLLAQDGQFLQVLEGSEPIVRGLLASIVHDPRHHDVRVLVEEVIRARRFPDWAMSAGHIDDIAALPIEEYYEGLLIARGTSSS